MVQRAILVIKEAPLVMKVYKDPAFRDQGLREKVALQRLAARSVSTLDERAMTIAGKRNALTLEKTVETFRSVPRSLVDQRVLKGDGSKSKRRKQMRKELRAESKKKLEGTVVHATLFLGDWSRIMPSGVSVRGHWARRQFENAVMREVHRRMKQQVNLMRNHGKSLFYTLACEVSVEARSTKQPTDPAKVVSAAHINRCGPSQAVFPTLANADAWRVRTFDGAGYAQSRDQSASFNIGVMAVWHKLAIQWNARCGADQRILVRPAVFLVKDDFAAWGNGELQQTTRLLRLF